MTSRPRPLLILLTLAICAAASAAPGASPGEESSARSGPRTTDVAEIAEPAPADQLTAPAGGPVDDGWLPGPDQTRTFMQFPGEPAPAGGPIWPGVFRDARRTALADGRNVDIQILHLGPDADVEVRPTLANGSVRGLAPVSAQSGDPLAGSVAAINGGFWLREPFGEPNGLFAVDGRLVSNAETQGAGPRGTVGWTADGRVLVDRIDSRLVLGLPDGSTLAVDGLNRGHREYDELFADGEHSVLAYTADYGGVVPVTEPRRPPPPPPESSPQDPPPPIPGEEPTPAATQPPQAPVDLAVLRISVPSWPAAGQATGTVIGISRDAAGTFTPNPGEVIVAATGTAAAALDGIAIDDLVSVATTLTALDPGRTIEWATITRALAGGPMIVKDGRMTAPGDWVNEGFEPHIHSDVRAPRTAIGVTADNRTIMITADGRRPGITHGFTIGELAEYMIALGTVEAVSLDGGGSSQLVVDAVVRNVPCCDSSVRAVADSLQIVHRYAFTHTTRLRGTGRVETAAQIARASHGGQGSRRALLAVAGSFPDALAGGPLATTMDAPVLLTGRDEVPAVTLQVLAELGVTGVTLLGGEGVIGPDVVTQLAERGVSVARVSGTTRFETAAAIASSAVQQGLFSRGGGRQRAFVVPADTFPDALISTVPGGLLGMPILLTGAEGLHPATRDLVADLDEVVVVDADGRLGAGVYNDLAALGLVVTRFGGGGRYATSTAVADWLASQTPLADAVVVARGDDFPDALAGGPFAARQRTPLILVPDGSIGADPATHEWFVRAEAEDRIGSAVILGGPAAVSSFHQWQLDQIPG